MFVLNSRIVASVIMNYLIGVSILLNYQRLEELEKDSNSEKSNYLLWLDFAFILLQVYSILSSRKQQKQCLFW